MRTHVLLKLCTRSSFNQQNIAKFVDEYMLQLSKKILQVSNSEDTAWSVVSYVSKTGNEYDWVDKFSLSIHMTGSNVMNGTFDGVPAISQRVCDRQCGICRLLWPCFRGLQMETKQGWGTFKRDYKLK